MSDRSKQYRDEPPTWWGMVGELLRKYQRPFYLTAAVILALAAVVNGAMILHVTTAEIGVMTALEGATGEQLETVVHTPEAVVTFGGQLVTATACIIIARRSGGSE